MKYDEYKSLSEDEQRAAYVESETLQNVEAERDSFKHENESLTAENKKLQEELKKTKELNFTLSRKISVEPSKSADEIINELFK